MANNPSTLPGYNGQTAGPDSNYIYGSARDDASPGDLTGTPRIAAEINDIMGFQQALLNAASIIPSGAPDTVLASQYLQSLQVITGLPWVTGTTYPADSWARGSDGHLYKAVISNSGNDPISDTVQTNWVPLQKVIPGVLSPNIIGGHPDNTIASGPVVRANTISGGGLAGQINHIDGDETRYATIGGGYDHYINGVASTTDLDGASSTISGGAHSEIRCTHATIGGGSFHLIGVASDYGTIPGGQNNEIRVDSSNSTIGGGNTQIINDNSDSSTIGGGSNNEITGPKGTISGGTGGTITDGSNNIICGGVNNTAGGGNATVLGGTTCTASGQGSVAWGRSALATARGALCFATDTAAGAGFTNNVANQAAFKFDEGFRFLGNKIITAPANNDGGIIEHVVETTAAITASSSINFADNIPANAIITGVQLRVNTAVSNTMDVAYTGGSTQSIITGFAFAQNSKANVWFDVNLDTNITSATTEITITRNGGGSFTAGGEVHAHIRYKVFTLLNNV